MTTTMLVSLAIFAGLLVILLVLALVVVARRRETRAIIVTPSRGVAIDKKVVLWVVGVVVLLGLVGWHWSSIRAIIQDPPTAREAWTLMWPYVVFVIIACFVLHVLAGFIPADKTKKSVRSGVWFLGAGMTSVIFLASYLPADTNRFYETGVGGQQATINCTVWTTERQICPYDERSLFISTGRRNDSAPVPCFDKAPMSYIDMNGQQQPWSLLSTGYSKGYVFTAPRGTRETVSIWLSADPLCP